MVVVRLWSPALEMSVLHCFRAEMLSVLQRRRRLENKGQLRDAYRDLPGETSAVWFWSLRMVAQLRENRATACS